MAKKPEDLKKMMQVGHSGAGAPVNMVGGAAAGSLIDTHPAYKGLEESASFKKMSYKNLQSQEQANGGFVDANAVHHAKEIMKPTPIVRTHGIPANLDECAAKIMMKTESDGKPMSFESQKKLQETRDMWARINKYHPPKAEPAFNAPLAPDTAEGRKLISEKAKIDAAKELEAKNPNVDWKSAVMKKGQSYNELKELEKAAPASPKKGHTIQQLERLQQDNWHNPDTGTELQPGEAEDHLMRLRDNKANKQVKEHLKVIEGGKKEEKKSKTKPEDFFGKKEPQKAEELDKAKIVDMKTRETLADLPTDQASPRRAHAEKYSDEVNDFAGVDATIKPGSRKDRKQAEKNSPPKTQPHYDEIVNTARKILRRSQEELADLSLKKAIAELQKLINSME